MGNVDIELVERLTLLDAAPGPDDVAPVEEIEYKEVGDDGGNR